MPLPKMFSSHFSVPSFTIAILLFLTISGMRYQSGRQLVVDEQEYREYKRDLNSSAVHVPWPHDQQCNKFDVRFGVNLQKVWLISYPRSGNTWMRYLVESATGIFTGSVYQDKILYKLGYLGEKEDIKNRSVILIKSHQECEYLTMGDSPAVVIVRNPRRSMESFFTFKNHNKSSSYEKHLAPTNEDIFKKPGFREFVPSALLNWEYLATLCLRRSKDINLVLYYENLVANPIPGLRKILKFLKFPAHEERLDCLKKHIEGPVNRGQKQFNPFTEGEETMIREAIARVSTIAHKHHLAKLPFV